MNTTYPPIDPGIVATHISDEDELAIYCKITNFAGLEKADKVVVQEQYSVKTKEKGSHKGSIRVRKETINSVDSYTVTTKVEKLNTTFSSNTEYSREVDREFFDAFKSISNSGMIKTRYTFNAKSIKVDDSDIIPEGTKFEVDVFKDNAGNLFSWCKIDVEFNSVLNQLKQVTTQEQKIKFILAISKLPINPVEVFTNKSADLTQRQILDHLYKHVFTIQKY